MKSVSFVRQTRFVRAMRTCVITVGREAAGTEAAGGPCAGNRISADGDVCRACVCSRRRAVTKVNVCASDRKHMHKYPQYLPVEHNNRFSDFEAPV